MSPLTRREWILIAASAMAVAASAIPSIRTLRASELRRSTSALVRGRAAGQRLGCFSCHGPDGRGGVPNAGSGEEVPAIGKAPFDRERVRVLILEGSGEKPENGVLKMPGYAKHLKDGELDDLVTWISSRPAGGSP